MNTIYKSEKEFGKSFVEVLHKLGFETWQEVYIGKNNYCLGYIDIVAKLKNIYFSYELKLQLNDKVLVQARRNLYLVNYSLVVIPYQKISNSSVKNFYAKHFGIGIIYIDPDYYLKNFKHINSNYIFRATRYKYLKAKRSSRKIIRKNKTGLFIENLLFDNQKNSFAGSINSSDNYKDTPFKRSCNIIYEYLKEHPKATKKEVWDILNKKLHWSSYNSMCTSFRNFGYLDVMKKIIWK